MRERDNAALAAEGEAKQDEHMLLIVEGDDRYLVQADAPFKDGELIGVHLAELGRDTVRRVKLDGERRLLCDDAGGLVELQDADRILGRVRTVARYF